LKTLIRARNQRCAIGLARGLHTCMACRRFERSKTTEVKLKGDSNVSSEEITHQPAFSSPEGHLGQPNPVAGSFPGNSSGNSSGSSPSRQARSSPSSSSRREACSSSGRQASSSSRREACSAPGRQACSSPGRQASSSPGRQASSSPRGSSGSAACVRESTEFLRLGTLRKAALSNRSRQKCPRESGGIFIGGPSQRDF
jgi:hypothetical protein